MRTNILEETLEKEVAVNYTWMKDDPSMNHFIVIIQFKDNYFDL